VVNNEKLVIHLGDEVHRSQSHD